MLLRVSSDQQLETDGDLPIQRQIVLDYIEKHKEEWMLDPDEKKREYFEGGVSGYKNRSEDREVLQTILQDAKNKEFEVLLLYKDDRMGRLMWDTPQYIMSLKNYGVDVYSVKDGCLTPDSDDIMGQMMLTFRFANAQKASADTGMRVKDTAQKLVENGKFMGGAAPYGYRLEYSGEISKHGRALKHLVIVPEQAEVVRTIYDLSLNKEFGSSKIARVLNLDERYKHLAPRDFWKSGTITSILTNPIYAGHTAYKRRERMNGQYHRLDSQDWIVAAEANEEIRIIDRDTWDRTQDKRKQRGDKYLKRLENQNVTIIKRNSGMLALVDVLYCGYCGCKMTNGSKYSYWTIKDTGERRAHRIPAYKCQNAWNGLPHHKVKQFRADEIEPAIFEGIAEYIGKMQENEDIFDEIEKNHIKEKQSKETEVRKEKQELQKIKRNIEVMEEKIPLAMQDKYPLSLDELASVIHKQKDILEHRQLILEDKEEELKQAVISYEDRGDIRKNIPTWQDVFLNADNTTKRVLVNKLIERIDVTEDEVVVRFKINLNDFLNGHRISDDHVVQKQRIQFYDYFLDRIRSEMDARAKHF